MADHPTPPNPFADIPDPDIIPPRHNRLSLVWLVPLAAALVGIALVAQALWQRGPTITVTFASAEGIEPGKTKVKFKDVDIGDVTQVRLRPGLDQVEVNIELTKDAAQFASSDSRFWVVRPRLAGTNISGLGTLLSGSYIGVDGGKSSEGRRSFAGLDEPPIIASDTPGRRFVLNAADIGSLDMGSPIYFRRIQVGYVESFTLDPDGSHIRLGVFVRSPYDHFVTEASHFWHASGVDLRLDANGVSLQTQSLATILLGGIAFETSDGEAKAAADGSQFDLAATRTEAMKRPDGPPQAVIMRFRQTVRGLSVGAPVDFRGIEIGQVRSIWVEYDHKADDFTAVVTADIYPDRLGGVEMGKLTQAQRDTGFRDMIRRGLRAQLRTGNFLTGQLYVALDMFPAAAPVTVNLRAETKELPTVPGDLEELHQQVVSILNKLNKIPFDTLGEDMHKTLVSLDKTLKRLDTLAAQADSSLLPEIRSTLAEVRQTMAVTQASVSPDAPLQQDTRQALRGVTEAARSLKALTDTLDRNPESLVRGKKDTP